MSKETNEKISVRGADSRSDEQWKSMRKPNEYSNTPQTKPNIDNKISTSDVKNMTGDKTAEASECVFCKVRPNYCYMCPFNDGKKEMLEWFENLVLSKLNNSLDEVHSTGTWVNGTILLQEIAKVKEELK